MLPLLAGTGVLEGEGRLALGWRAFPLPSPFNFVDLDFLANGDCSAASEELDPAFALHFSLS